MKIARVFPTRTKATPVDSLAFYGEPPRLLLPEVDEVHISVVFTWDKERAERLAEQWELVAPVRIGGPAYNQPGAAFVPGRYVREGYTISSRGCPNRCWFCQVWRREPALKQLDIVPGYNLLDDNILACSEAHVRAVFAMLKEQPAREFTGGLEAKRLKPWHVGLLAWLKPKQLFFAYDTPDDYEPLVRAARLLWQAGFTPQSHCVRAYVLMGWPRDGEREADTFIEALSRLRQVLALGIIPMAMLWRDESGRRDPEWIHFQKLWARPASICAANITSESSGRVRQSHEVAISEGQCALQI